MSAASRSARRGEIKRHLREHVEGMTAGELAELMGVSASTVRRTLTDPEFAREVPVVSDGHRWRIEDEPTSNERPAQPYEVTYRPMAQWRADINEADLAAYRDYPDTFPGAVEHGLRVLGSAAALERWLSDRQAGLGNRSPLSLLIEGEYRRIHTILGYIEHGIVA